MYSENDLSFTMCADVTDSVHQTINGTESLGPKELEPKDSLMIKTKVHKLCLTEHMKQDVQNAL